MSEQNLVKFVDFMRKSGSATDMELVKLGKSLGLDLVSFKKLRESQDDEFTDKIRNKSLNLLNQYNEHQIKNKEVFFVGSIDFMIAEDKEGKVNYFLLEANGGSSRGLSILTPKQQKLIYDGYMEAINLALEKDYNKDSTITILVGVPVNDGLIHEKAILISYLRDNLQKKNYKLGIYSVDDFSKETSDDIRFIVADYKQLSDRVSYNNYWVRFSGVNIQILIGDGIARRLRDDDFQQIITENLEKLNTIIVNPIYLITDDKSLSYLAKHLVNDKLEKYQNATFLFTKAFNDEELAEKIKLAVNSYDRPFIIKPHGGSGGAGVMSIFPGDVKNDELKIKKIIEESKKEYYEKFMKTRNPYPYTIQEMAKFSLIDWRGGKHTFDIRIYLTQIDGKLIPVGGLARIARGSFISGLNKEEFVVNLSGFDGRIEVDRGLGFSSEAAKLLGLNLDHFIELFCNSCIIFKSIAENYQKIVDFAKWEKIIGPEKNGS
jgi:hypothetical protein